MDSRGLFRRREWIVRNDARAKAVEQASDATSDCAESDHTDDAIRQLPPLPSPPATGAECGGGPRNVPEC